MSVEKLSDEMWVGVKFQSNAEKAKPEVVDLWGKDLHHDQRYLVEWRGKANHRG